MFLDILDDIRWFKEVVNLQIKVSYNNYLKEEFILDLPVEKKVVSNYSNFIEKYKLTLEDRLLLIFALIPHLEPSFYKDNFTNNHILKHIKSGLGIDEEQIGFTPKGLIYIFILSGKKLENRIVIINYLLYKSFLVNKGIVRMLPSPLGEPVFSGGVALNPEIVKVFFNEKILQDNDWNNLIHNEYGVST